MGNLLNVIGRGVLILVVMEDALARHFLELGRNEDVVLILVVMEDALALELLQGVTSEEIKS